MDGNRKISVTFAFYRDGGVVTEDCINFPATKEEMRRLHTRADSYKAVECRIKPEIWENETASPIGSLPNELEFNEANVNELNYLAAKLSELGEEDFSKFEAVIESGRYLGSAGVGNGDLTDYINIADNLDNFTFHPNMDAEGYGEHLLTDRGNLVDQFIQQLQFSSKEKDIDFIQYVECLRECADVEQFGQSMANNNDGEFLDSGFLIEDGGFNAEYYGVLDIPEEYRIWEQPETFIKVTDIDLCGLLMEMHALGGNYTQDAADNILKLVGSDNFFITENRGSLMVLPAAEVFRKDSPDYTAFQVAYEPDAHAFFASLDESLGSEFLGSLHEINTEEMKDRIGSLSYSAVSIDVEFKDGTNLLYAPAEWFALSDWEQKSAAGIVYRYNPDDENHAADFINNLREDGSNNGRMVTQEDFLATINATFMAKTQNAQPGMFRIAREAARDMVAQNDAEVYRLLPEGALKLSPIDVIKSNGLWFKEHREFAIKPGGLAGLRKWANRTAEDIMRKALCDEHKKSRDNEL